MTYKTTDTHKTPPKTPPTVPQGAIIMWEGVTAPRGWCSVSAVIGGARGAERPADVDSAAEIVRQAVRDTVEHHLVA